MPNLHGTPGERIADLREQRGLKKKELADMVGVDASTIGRIESNETHKIDSNLILNIYRKIIIDIRLIKNIRNLRNAFGSQASITVILLSNKCFDCTYSINLFFSIKSLVNLTLIE